MKYVITLLSLITVLFSGVSFAGDSSTLKQIKETEIIRIGYRQDEPPMSFLNKNKQPVGYSIDLCLHIVNDVKIKLKNPNIATKFVPVTASNRFKALENNEIDILCGSTTKTLSRSELVDFTQLTFITGADILSLKTSHIKEISDLKGKKVAVVKDTTTANSLRNALEKVDSDAEIITVDSADVGMEAVLNGEVDAFSSDQIVLMGLILTNEDVEKLTLTGKIFSQEPFALAVRRNDSDFRLIANRTLSRLNRSRKIGLIYRAWFSPIVTKIPPLHEAMYILNSTPE